MSFMRALGTVAVGFAAAKGVEKYRKMGGMAGMQDMFAHANQPGGMNDQVAQMADRMGIPGGSKAVRDIMASFGGGSAAAGTASGAGAAGLGGLLNSWKSTMDASSKNFEEMFASMHKGTAVNAMMEENAKLMIRAMIQAAKADGELDEDEKQKILEHMKDATPEERAFVEEQMNAPIDYGKLARDTGEAMKAQVYSTSLMAIKVDGAAEIAYLKGLSKALGLTPAARDQIHTQMGVAPLSA